MKNKLALLGGEKTIRKEFPPYNPYGPEEVEAAKSVIESGILSRFLGVWHEDFYGGDKVRAFEKAWADHFKVKSAVAVNSATSGLMAAVGAIGVEPGDEVIVSPFTMCATATSILIWNAIPVFADIEPNTFGLDPVSVEKNITPRTRAIVVTDILGHAAELDALIALARKHNLRIIEDAAQAPEALDHGRYVGTIADIGVFSLNYHKHIHTGEGGVCVTNDPVLLERMQLIRNHAEAVVGGKKVSNLSNMVGFNFRLGEIESAMGLEQLKKLKRWTEEKTRFGTRLSQALRGLPGLKMPVVREGCTHVYYGYPLVADVGLLGVSREKIVSALRAEGVPDIGEGYVNVHRLPMYQKKIAYGTKGFPWTADFYKGHVSYEKGICPVAEELHDVTLIDLSPCKNHFTEEDADLIGRAFRKVWDSLDELK